MLDWKKIVRDKLSPLPMDLAKLEEIVEELSEQLQDAYREARESGQSEARAAEVALGQFRDWEKLRAEICESSEGNRLPVWQTKGFLSPRRPAVWIALAVSCVFLLLPSFQKALDFLPLRGALSSWDQGAFSEKALKRLETSGDQQKYARALAYVALHCPDDTRVVPAAEKAITLSPQLTWIAAKVSHANYLYPGYDPKPWLDRLETWDPGNAYVYVLEAGAAVHPDWESRWMKFNAPRGDLRRALADDPRWRSAMEKAFAAPRADSYIAREFQLDRQVLLENGRDQADTLLMAAASAVLPDLTMVKMYADYEAIDAIKTKPPSEQAKAAVGAYQNALRFAAKIESPSEAEQRLQLMLRRDAYERLSLQVPSEDAHFLSTVFRSLESAAEAGHKRIPFQARPDFRAGQIASIAGAFLLLFGSLSAVWLFSVGLLRFGPGNSRVLNKAASSTAWAPCFLPFACFILYLTFLPYSASIASYSDADAIISTSGYFFLGSRSISLELGSAARPVFWYALIAALIALGMLSLFWLRSRRPSQEVG